MEGLGQTHTYTHAHAHTHSQTRSHTHPHTLTRACTRTPAGGGRQHGSGLAEEPPRGQGPRTQETRPRGVDRKGPRGPPVLPHLERLGSQTRHLVLSGSTAARCGGRPGPVWPPPRLHPPRQAVVASVSAQPFPSERRSPLSLRRTEVCGPGPDWTPDAAGDRGPVAPEHSQGTGNVCLVHEP